MVDYKSIVEKLKRRVSKEEWVNGVDQYVNAPDFPEKYNEQINKAIENYKKAGAPEAWSIKQGLKLKLVSADEWKQAITAQGVADKYYNDLINALNIKEKYFAIPAEQDNTIIDIIEQLKITDTKKRMLVAYDVGQYFEKAVLYKLAGDTNNYNNTVNSFISSLERDGIVNSKNANQVNTVKQIFENRVSNCINVLTS